MKVSDLTGALLDYWVARAQGNEARININETEILLTDGHRGIGPQWYIFEPSSNWHQGGPIIEREQIALRPTEGGWESITLLNAECEPWEPSGPTPLIAAMRAYVASEFGETVPDDWRTAP